MAAHLSSAFVLLLLPSSPRRLSIGTARIQNVLLRKSKCRIRWAAASISDLVPPPIDHDLHDMLEEHGAQISEDGVVQTFGRDEEAVNAAMSTCAVVEMSHFGRLRISGDDRLRFLHNQSTADFLSLKEGDGCDTVFVTPTARTIDLATAWVMNSAVILFVSPSTVQELTTLFNKYIFFSDKVEVENITEKTSYLSVIGPESDKVMSQLNMEALIDKPYGTHAHYAVNGTPITAGVGSGLSLKGYTILMSTAAGGLVWNQLLKAGALPMGAAGWERLRLLEGRPAAGKELVNEFNVLEAGLWKTISQTKGCYIGQETIARLITYDGVKQQLFGLELQEPAEPGTAITVNGAKVGKLTSCCKGIRSPFFGLAYIRRQAGAEGLQVDVAGKPGSVVQVPYLMNPASRSSKDL